MILLRLDMFLLGFPFGKYEKVVAKVSFINGRDVSGGTPRNHMGGPFFLTQGYFRVVLNKGDLAHRGQEQMTW